MNQLIFAISKNIKHTFDNFYTNNIKNIQIIESIKNIYNHKNNHMYIWEANRLGNHICYFRHVIIIVKKRKIVLIFL